MKIKPLIIFLFLTCSFVNGQRVVVPSETIKIEGKIKAGTTFTIADLEMFQKIAIPNQKLFNHRGEPKGTLTNIKGIPIKTLLGSIEFEYDKPKELNEFYFVFVATDGYKVVFSWNEIYNTEAGNSFYIITEMEGKAIKEMDQRILFISTADLKSGRRYIKALEKIEVKRLE